MNSVYSYKLFSEKKTMSIILTAETLSLSLIFSLMTEKVNHLFRIIMKTGQRLDFPMLYLKNYEMNTIIY